MCQWQAAGVSMAVETREQTENEVSGSVAKAVGWCGEGGGSYQACTSTICAMAEWLFANHLAVHLPLPLPAYL